MGLTVGSTLNVGISLSSTTAAKYKDGILYWPSLSTIANLVVQYISNFCAFSDMSQTLEDEPQ